ncbi:unnamed protein product [Periconia digitata]|uniref:Zn(2)-C6 fungal-type domain-containing protein n=1 Tax=Periconia digitata TaxID=1303443 RepID=A0A9W4UB78_9PLEO|nr:unnamed protein product [Periconia digitata]
MSEENWAAHGGVVACDRCHWKKVKCDREDPCGNCIGADTHCLRNRQKRPLRRQRMKTDDKIRLLLERLTSLENAANVGSSLPVHATGPSPLGHIRRLSESEASTSSKKTRTHEPLTYSALSSSASVPSHGRSPNNDRELLQEELSHNSLLASYQQTVLQTAISLADELSKSPSHPVENTAWDKVSTDLAPGELVQILLQINHSGSDPSHWNVHTLDHLPPGALEKMVHGLLEGTVDERVLNMYKVNVHFKAALGLYASQLEISQTDTTRLHVKKRQLHHLNAALTALDGVSFLASPSLLLLQTLLTGAILMQIIGNSTACWSLTTHASRTLVLLGYHIHPEASSADDSDLYEIHAAVAWCYHFDRLLSLLLLRPLSLPRYRVPVASLVQRDTSNPAAVFAAFMLETVPVMEQIVQLTVNCVHKKAVTTSAVGQLRNSMESIYSEMQAARSEDLFQSSPDYMLHWYSLEFRYYSLLTSVHRLSPTVVTNPTEREQCLASARKALGYVKMIHVLGKQQGHFIEDFSPYISWTILSYPISPFFVLFCNVVGTYNVSDFLLLHEVVDILFSLVVENKYVERLRRLCSSLLALCKPLVRGSEGTEHQQQQRPPEVPEWGTVTASTLHGDSSAPSLSTDDANQLGSWDDDMLSQLFSCQPSLDWFNSDILDPGLWDSSIGM